MTFSLTQIPLVGQYFDCGNMYKSAAAGALVAATNTDLVFAPLVGAGAYTHFALAGVAMDAFCKGRYTPDFDRQLAYNAAAGIAGGIAMRMVFPRGVVTVPFVGTPVP